MGIQCKGTGAAPLPSAVTNHTHNKQRLTTQEGREAGETQGEKEKKKMVSRLL